MKSVSSVDVDFYVRRVHSSSEKGTHMLANIVNWRKERDCRTLASLIARSKTSIY